MQLLFTIFFFSIPTLMALFFLGLPFYLGLRELERSLDYSSRSPRASRFGESARNKNMHLLP